MGSCPGSQNSEEEIPIVELNSKLSYGIPKIGRGESLNLNCHWDVGKRDPTCKIYLWANIREIQE